VTNAIPALCKQKSNTPVVAVASKEVVQIQRRPRNNNANTQTNPCAARAFSSGVGSNGLDLVCRSQPCEVSEAVGRSGEPLAVGFVCTLQPGPDFKLSPRTSGHIDEQHTREAL